MSRNISEFMNCVSSLVFDAGYPFIWWDTSLGKVSVTIIDKEKHKVTQNFDRYFIEHEGRKELAYHVVDMLCRRFENRQYDKDYEYNWKRKDPFLEL